MIVMGTIILCLDVTPTIPASFTHSSFQSTQGTLTWTSLSTDVVNVYTISYRRTGGCSSAPSGSSTTTMKTITISDLEENIQYEFTITATNSAGRSLPAMTTATTLSTSKQKNTIIIS